VLGGQSPVVGATVTIYAAGQPASAAATAIATATSDANGRFDLAFNCSATALPMPATLMYVTAHGGNAGSGSNSAIGMMAALGQCQSLPAAIDIDEITTVAAVFALDQFFGAAQSIQGDTPGLPNAMAMAAALADPVSGTLASSLPAAAACGASGAPANCATAQRIDALANALSACVKSSGPGSGACTELFHCAVPGAQFNGGDDCTLPGGAAPVDTLAAVLSIARNPGLVPAAGIYDAAVRNPLFSPSLASAPGDWALSLNYTGLGLSEPTASAIDATGNVWIANYNGGVVKLSPLGALLSPAGGYAGGGLEESFGIAIDAGGNAWICNEQSVGSINSGRGSLTELGADGSVISSHGYSGGGLDFPESVAVDAAGNIWAGNFGNSTVSEFSQSGTALSPAAGFSAGGIDFPVGLAFDPSGNLWVANQGSNTVSALGPAGAAVSPAAGYGGGGLDVPQAIAVDQQGHVWIADYYGNSVAELSTAGVPLSPAAGYGDGGLAAPGGIAIDGAGRVWATNFRGASLSELAGAGSATPGAALSPAAGFTAAGMDEPFSPAIDGAGNLWTANFANNSVTVFIGIAAPVRTPMIGPPASP